MKVSRIETMISNGFLTNRSPHDIAISIATEIDNEWYNKEKDAMRVIIRR